MQTRPRRIVPLRPPAAVTAPAPDRTRADSETHVQLQATFAGFYNALFDAACLANDEQRHARTIQLLRAVKAQEHVIIEGICADIARPGVPAEAPGARVLERALARHCGALALEPGERALLETACAEQLLAPEKRARPAAAGDRDSAARLVARLRAVGLELGPATTTDGADGASPGSTEPAPEPAAESAPTAVAQDPRRRVTRHALMAALLAAVLAVLSTALLEPVGREIRPPAPVAARILPSPVARAAPVVASGTRQAATPPLPAGEPALAPASATPVTQPAPADALQSPEAPAVAAQIEPVAAPEPDAAPGATERLATQVSYLLQRGDAALAALRLSEPFADSAAANYTAVLAIDAQNAEARRGLERIVTAYTGLARSALQRGDTRYARQLLARARTVLPGSVALQQLEQEIGNTPAAGP